MNRYLAKPQIVTQRTHVETCTDEYKHWYGSYAEKFKCVVDFEKNSSVLMIKKSENRNFKHDYIRVADVFGLFVEPFNWTDAINGLYRGCLGADVLGVRSKHKYYGACVYVAPEICLYRCRCKNKRILNVSNNLQVVIPSEIEHMSVSTITITGDDNLNNRHFVSRTIYRNKNLTELSFKTPIKRISQHLYDRNITTLFLKANQEGTVKLSRRVLNMPLETAYLVNINNSCALFEHPSIKRLHIHGSNFGKYNIPKSSRLEKLKLYNCSGNFDFAGFKLLEDLSIGRNPRILVIEAIIHSKDSRICEFANKISSLFGPLKIKNAFAFDAALEAINNNLKKLQNNEVITGELKAGALEQLIQIITDSLKIIDDESKKLKTNHVLTAPIKNLKKFKIMDYYNIDEILEFVYGCKKLEKLSIKQCNISTIPKSITSLKNLKQLTLKRNALETIPDYLFELPLETLNISQNNIETLPPIKSTTLLKLNIKKNKIIILDNISAPLEQLLAQKCKIKYVGPNINFNNMVILNIHDNDLSELPNELNVGDILISYHNNKFSPEYLEHLKTHAVKNRAFLNNTFLRDLGGYMKINLFYGWGGRHPMGIRSKISI